MTTDIFALGTFSDGSHTSWTGVIRDRQVARLSDLVAGAPVRFEDLFNDWNGWVDRIAEVLLAAPTVTWISETELNVELAYRPDNLFGAGANYRRHVVELIVDKGVGGVKHLDAEARRAFGEKLMDERASTGKPFIFTAARGAIIGARDVLTVPYDTTEPDWELELAVVISRPARRVPLSQALTYVAGYTIANDITSRELVDRPDVPQMGMDWFACKSAAGYKILGPYVTPARFVSDPQDLRLRLALNGDVMQDEGSDDMIFGVARLIEFISSHTLLRPGDVIMTGSPSGNGTHYDRYLRDGDVMIGEIEGLVGHQQTRCRLESL